MVRSVQKAVADLYKGYTSPLELFDFKPLSTGFERVGSDTMAQVLYPRSLVDMLGFYYVWSSGARLHSSLAKAVGNTFHQSFAVTLNFAIACFKIRGELNV